MSDDSEVDSISGKTRAELYAEAGLLAEGAAKLNLLNEEAINPPPPPPVDGMPGTWSHCGKQRDHAAHRHTVTFMEGPYHNILCKGTPGDPDADAPLGRIVYDNG